MLGPPGDPFAGSAMPSVTALHRRGGFTPKVQNGTAIVSWLYTLVPLPPTWLPPLLSSLRGLYSPSSGLMVRWSLTAHSVKVQLLGIQVQGVAGAHGIEVEEQRADGDVLTGVALRPT